MRFAKLSALRWVGHRDLMRGLERLFRRGGLPLAMSQGFHPKPRMTFPLALAVGIEGCEEVMELELTEPLEAETVLARLRPLAPPGLEWLRAELLPPGAGKARVAAAAYRVDVGPWRSDALAESVDRLLAADAWPIARQRRAACVDLRASLLALGLAGDVLSMRLRVDQRGSAGPRDVLAALGLADIERRGARLVRTALELAPYTVRVT
jgi:radical SAM-linked protein